MSDRIQVFSKSNQKQAEFIGSCARSWHATRTGRATLEIQRDALPELAIAISSRWVIGNANLPSWVGVMTTPFVSAGDVYRITLTSAECLLDGRYTPWGTSLSGTGGEIITHLLALANISEATGITTGSVSLSGSTITRNYRNHSIADAMRELTSDLDTAWWITGGIDSNELVLYLNYGAARGATLTTQYVENYNLFIASAGWDGDIANSITAVGFSTGEDQAPPSHTAVDTVSQGLYGLIQDVVIAPDMEDTSSLQALASSHVSRRAYPRLTVQAVVTQPPYPSVADILSVWLNSRGLLDGRHTMRVQECSFDPRENLMAMTLREVT